MKSGLIPIIVVLVLVATPALAQTNDACPPARPAGDSLRIASAKPDVMLVAKVKAQSVRFEKAPEGVGVDVRGCPALDTTRVSIRTNLPKPVQAGVTYRDVEIEYRLAASIREIDCAILRGLENLRARGTVVADSLLRQMGRACTSADSTRIRR